MKKKKISRREFIKSSVAASIAASLTFTGRSLTFPQPMGKSRVVLIRRKELWLKPGSPDPLIIQEMLDQAVAALFEEKNALSAWKKVVGPTDIVGIKTNAWQNLPTPPELEGAIQKRVMDTGVPKELVSVNDRGVRKDPIFMKATALINVRPMRAHDWSGLGTCIKNYIMFADSPPQYHPDSCADLAALWKLPMVKGKTRLNILVLLTPLFHSVGPHSFSQTYTWEYNGMIVGIDPVAVDSTGMRIIQAKRREHFNEDRPINPPAKHILLADTRHGLGNATEGKIELVRLGWQEQSLI